MSIPLLVEVYDEVRRVAIAGSAVAPGDFRLKKLVPPLEKSGERAPVFARVAQAVKVLIESNEKTASSALLELTTLVNAILYTQGETGKAGEFVPLETVDLGQQMTQSSARLLKPLLEAMSSTGSGRLELIRDAVERGAFKDLRLVRPAMRALDDPYPEIAQLIAEKVLPAYGKAILPELRATIDIKGRSGHLHRLALMHRLDAAGTRELVQKTLAEGSKEMKVVAIECLGTTVEDLNYLTEQSRAKAKDVRAAALRALTAAGGKETIAIVKKAIDADDLELIVYRLQTSRVPELQDYVLATAEAQLEYLLKSKNKDEQGKAIRRMEMLIGCLKGRTDAPAEAFLLHCLESAGQLSAIKSEPSGSDLNEFVAHILSLGTPSMQKQLAACHAQLSGEMLRASLLASRAIMSPDAFFTAFNTALRDSLEKRSKKGELGQLLTAVLSHDDFWIDYVRPWARSHDHSTVKLPDLDPRWLDAAVDAGKVDLVCKLARPGHAVVNQFLAMERSKAKEANVAFEIVETMVRVGHPEATDAVLSEIRKRTKDSKPYYYGYSCIHLVSELPRSALPKVEAMLPELPEKCVDSLMDEIMILKNKPE